MAGRKMLRTRAAHAQLGDTPDTIGIVNSEAAGQLRVEVE